MAPGESSRQKVWRCYARDAREELEVNVRCRVRAAECCDSSLTAAVGGTPAL